MSVISITQKGSFDNIDQFLRQQTTSDISNILKKYGEKGVIALAQATPVDSSQTANSWYYEIVSRSGYCSIRWHNSHIEDGRPIAILLDYGHGTRNGGYVQGREYIMPAIQPIFDEILNEVTREVTK